MRFRNPTPPLLLSGLLAACAVFPVLGIDAEEGGTRALEAFAAPSEDWGHGVEAVIEEAYRACFKTYIIDGRVLTVRMPFAENNERAELADGRLEVHGGGKADPELLWREADALLASADFLSYAAALGDGKEKVIAFDLEARSWSVVRDLFAVARMKADDYPGLPHKPFVFSDGTGVQATDVYNYLYCVGRLGMDCSGFVWHVLSTVAARGGTDLSRALMKPLRSPQRSATSLYFGTWFFSRKEKELIEVDDRIAKLRPLDIIVFRGEDGDFVHSMIIQSIDRERGTLRYLQSTDEAPLEERGVHESILSFDPARPDLRLGDMEVLWKQRRHPPFEGERTSDYSDDGTRYRAYPELGGGKVFRLRSMAAPASRIEQRKPR